LARVYIARQNRDDVQKSVDAARQLILELATSLREIYPAQAEHFTQEALTSLPEIPEPSAEQQLKQQFGGLTAREREIAALVAQGKTNREIADEFVLSERTAERHIANIMKKLGFNSRAQIAAWAVEKGLNFKQPS
jgi:DNA-binding NarL/FixJ family response regulator